MSTNNIKAYPYQEYLKDKREFINSLVERYRYLKEEITFQENNGTFWRILSPIEDLIEQRDDILNTIRRISE
jgi:hypothetical protein